MSLAPQDLLEGSVELQLSELLEGDRHDQMTSFFFLGVPGHSFFWAIFKASDIQHNNLFCRYQVANSTRQRVPQINQ